MVFNCSICSESLEKGPGQNPDESLFVITNEKSNLTAAPCGHIFHSFCINKWLGGGLTSSNKCPCCRKTIGVNKKCFPIFPDSYDESFSEGRSNADDNIINAQTVVPCNHAVQINELERRIQDISNELEEQTQLYRMQCDDYAALNTKYRKEREIGETYLVRYKQSESLKDLYNKLSIRSKSLEEENKKYIYVNSVLEGVKHEAKDDLKNFRIDENSIHTLIEVKHLLQTELETSKRNFETTKKETDKLNRMTQRQLARISELEAEIKELTNVNKTLRQKVKSQRSFTYTPSPGPSYAVSKRLKDVTVYNPLSMKSRKALKQKHDATIIIESDDDIDDVDMDVGVLKLKPYKIPASQHRRRALIPGSEVNSTSSSSSSSTSRLTLQQSTSHPSLTISKPKAKTIVQAERSLSPIFLNGRSNICGVAPISPLANSKRKNFQFKKKRKAESTN